MSAARNAPLRRRGGALDPDRLVPRSRRALRATAVYAALVVLSLFILLPIGWMLTTALTPDTATIFTFPPEFIPTEYWRWENFVDALTAEGEPYLRYVFNTTVLVLANMTGAVVANSLIAYPFARLRFRGRNTLFVILLATLLLPAPVRLIPRELDEAARIDGAGYFTIYRRIILPLTAPALTVVAVFTFLGTWNDFFGPLIYLQDPDMFTVAVALATQVSRVGVKWNLLMASNLLAIIPPLAIYFIAQKKLIGGIASVGIRGGTWRGHARHRALPQPGHRHRLPRPLDPRRTGRRLVVGALHPAHHHRALGSRSGRPVAGPRIPSVRGAGRPARDAPGRA